MSSGYLQVTIIHNPVLVASCTRNILIILQQEFLLNLNGENEGTAETHFITSGKLLIPGALDLYSLVQP